MLCTSNISPWLLKITHEKIDNHFEVCGQKDVCVEFVNVLRLWPHIPVLVPKGRSRGDGLHVLVCQHCILLIQYACDEHAVFGL